VRCDKSAECFALTLDLTDGPCGYKLKLCQRSSISLCADYNKEN